MYLYQLNKLLNSCLAIDTNHGANECRDISSVQLIALLTEVGVFVILLRTQFLPENFLQFTDIVVGQRFKVEYLLQYGIILQMGLQVVHYFLAIGGLHAHRSIAIYRREYILNINDKSLALFACDIMNDVAQLLTHILC